MAIRMYVNESMAYRVTRYIQDSGQPLMKAGEEFAVECSLVKIFGSETLDYVVDEALQIHGGYGYHQDYPVERAYRDARINRIFEGTNEINRMIITGWLMKRAVSGQLALMPAIKKLMDEVLAGPQMGEPLEGALAAERTIVANAKRAALMVSGAATQKYMMALQEQQEVMGAMADMIIEVFAMESALLRTQKLIARNGEELEVLKHLNDRNIYDFKLTKSKQPQHVGPVQIVLHSTDPKRYKFDMTVIADDKSIDKKDRNVDEPMQFYVRGVRAPYELVVWNVASRGLKVIGSSPLRPTSGPLWSGDGTEVTSLQTTAPISYAPGVPLEGTAQISIATVSSATTRALETDRPFIPLFADGTVVAGTSLAGDRTYVVVDAHSGRTMHVLDTTAWAAVQPTPDRDVIIAFGESTTAGAYALYALDVRTGTELSRITGPQFVGPMPAWPGRNEIALTTDGELKAFDYKTSAVRVVGSLGDSVAFGFDDLGQTLLVVRSREPSFGTVTVRDGRLTSAITVIAPEPSPAGRPLGLVRLRS